MSKSLAYILYIILLVLLLSTGFLGFKYYQSHKELLATTDRLSAQLSQERAQHEAELTQLSSERDGLNKQISDLTSNVESLTEERDDLEDQVGDALKTVGTLNKLSKIDPELLQKYSKVYFLNEHYQPARLSVLDEDYLYDQSKEIYFLTQALPFFKNMMSDAKDDGVDLSVESAFRSFETQSTLKGAYTVTYGSGANSFSADQGYSEHQLGTTIDFTTKAQAGALDGFDKTPAYAWLTKNAYKYGFVLSYPQGNSYYIFEPWHWRFVGIDLATKLHEDHKYFYDLDQRDINTYLVSLFDK